MTTVAFATPPASETASRRTARSLVERTLLEPLAAKERQRSRYSRVAQAPQVRRVRVLDTEPRKDRDGAAFMAFTVDAQHGLGGSKFRNDTLDGCVYLESGKVFVSREDTHLPAEALLGKRTPPAAGHVCHSAATEVASKQRR